MATLKINGDTSGYVELVSPAVAGSTSIELDKILVADSSGNVGIGTSSPNAKLDVVAPSSAEAINIRGRSADDIGQLKFYENDGTTSLARLDARTTHFEVGAYNELRFSAGGVGNSHIVIDTSGNVGIGTSSPDANSGLTVESSTTSGQIMIKGNGGGNAGISLRASGQTTNFSIYENSGANLVFQKHASERMRIDSSGNVGIGETVPDGKVHIRGGAGGGGSLWIQTDGAFAGTDSAFLNFRHYDDTGNPTAQIKALGTSNYTGDMVFSVRAGGTSGAGGAALNERMRIDSSGKVGIGTNNPTGSLHTTVKDSNGSDVYVVAQNTTSNRLAGFKVLDESGTVSLKMQYDNGSNIASISNPNNGALGIYLGGTGAANLLDDYEEGTWLPGLEFASPGGTATTESSTYTTGSYVKIGSAVTVQFNISGVVFGNGTGNVHFQGLPFTPNGISAYAGKSQASSGHLTSATTASSYVDILKIYGVNPLNVMFSSSGSAWNFLNNGNATTVAPNSINGSFTYYTNS